MDLFEISDDEGVIQQDKSVLSENIVMVMGKPSAKKKYAKKPKVGAVPKVDKRSVKDDKARQEMCERLEKARVKALETRQKNKADRDLLAKEEKDKVEKVATYLKNDDLFEKKYANKFDKITDMLSNVESYLSETKDLKKKKLAIKEEEKMHKERAMQMVKDDLIKLQEAEAKVREDDEKTKLKIDLRSKEAILVKTYGVAPIIGATLPNYRAMQFGRRGKSNY